MCSVGSNIVKNKAEDIVLNEEGVAQGLQHKVLHEGLGRVLYQKAISVWSYDLHDFKQLYGVTYQQNIEQFHTSSVLS